MRILTLCIFLMGSLLLKAEHPFVYLFPLPNSVYHTQGTSVIVRPGYAITPEDVRILERSHVTGSLSGTIGFRVVTADQGRVALLKFDRRLMLSETVQVTFDKYLRDKSGRYGEAPFSFSFSVMSGWGDAPPTTEEDLVGEPNNSPQVTPNQLIFKEYFPTASGELFMTGSLPGFTALNIADNAGNFVFQASNSGSMTWNFQAVRDTLIAYFAAGKINILNTNYTLVKSYQASMEYITDFHEFLLPHNRNPVVLCNHNPIVDMSELVVGGDTSARILSGAIQELDEDSGEPIFVWRALDYFSIFDAVAGNGGPVDFTGSVIEHTHCNALDVDIDGNYLLSSRNMNRITKIDRLTGDIIWDLGGVHNQFTFVNDSFDGFSLQHCAKFVPSTNGMRITLLDNGVFHVPPTTRALEYELDTTNHTATVVWEYEQPEGAVSSIMGSVQRFANGNTLIGWGRTSPGSIGQPVSVCTEVSDENFLLFDIKPLQQLSGFPPYRVFRFPWSSLISSTHAAESAQSMPITIRQIGGELLLNLSNTSSSWLRASLIGVDGRVLATQSGTGASVVRFDISTLPSGVYIYALTSSKGSATGKVFIP